MIRSALRTSAWSTVAGAPSSATTRTPKTRLPIVAPDAASHPAP